MYKQNVVLEVNVGGGFVLTAPGLGEVWGREENGEWLFTRTSHEEIATARKKWLAQHIQGQGDEGI